MRKTAIYQRKRAGASTWYNKWIQSPGWLKGFLISIAVCGSIYLVNVIWGRLAPGSIWGVTYGIGAAVLFVGTFLYAARRKAIRISRLHRAWYYLQFHVYGGTIFLLLVLMHTNFGLPQGTLTWWLWALSIWIVLTGILGSILQKWIPSILNSSLATEVNYARIPDLISDVQKMALQIVDQSGDQIKKLFLENMENRLGSPEFRWIYFVDVAGTIRQDLKSFSYLGKYLDAGEKERLDKLEEICKTKLEIDAHYTLQKVLRLWLVLHIPVSVIILMLLVIHVFTVIYY